MTEPQHDPLSEALHDAVARAATEHAHYRVPEGAVRASARRRRTVRAVGASALSLALLAGAGLAVANLGDDRADVGPHAQPADPARTHPACGADHLATTFPHSWIRFEARGGSRANIGVGDPLDVTTVLVNDGNQTDDPLEVDVAEGPVLLALDDAGVVIGYSRLLAPPGPVTVVSGASEEYTGYGPMYKCPGVGDPTTYPYLPPGEYALFVGQQFLSVHESLSLWDRVGPLTVAAREATPAPTISTPVPTVSPSDRVGLLAGACGAPPPLVDGGSTDAVHFEVRTPDVVFVASAAPHLDVRHVNPTQYDVTAPTQGGPVILVLDGDRVVAQSRTTDPLRTGDLPAGKTWRYTAFEPLEDCATGDPLEPGRYDYVVARWRDDQTTRLVDFVTQPAHLEVTDGAVDPTERPVTWPDSPRCGEAISDLEIHPAAHRSELESFRVHATDESDGGGGGMGPPDSVVELHARLVAPLEDLETTTYVGLDYVLVRDGTVVATYGGALDGTAVDVPALHTVDETFAFRSCALDVPYVIDGEHTLFGYSIFSTVLPSGQSSLLLVAVGPETFTHAAAAP